MPGRTEDGGDGIIIQLRLFGENTSIAGVMIEVLESANSSYYERAPREDVDNDQ